MDNVRCMYLGKLLVEAKSPSKEIVIKLHQHEYSWYWKNWKLFDRRLPRINLEGKWIYTQSNADVVTLLKVKKSTIHRIGSTLLLKLFLETPLANTIETARSIYIACNPPLENIGIRDLTIIGNWTGYRQDENSETPYPIEYSHPNHEELIGRTIHHKSWQDDSAYKIFSLEGVANSWIRDVNIINSSFVMTAWCTGCTFQNIGYQNRVRGHVFLQANGQWNLIKDVYPLDDQTPGFVHGVGVGWADGTVIKNVTYSFSSGFDSHGKNASNTLFDFCSGGIEFGSVGGSEAVKHLKNLVFWNFWNQEETCYRVNQLQGEEYGDVYFTPERACKTFDRDSIPNVTFVEPLSLYDEQMKIRKKILPMALSICVSMLDHV